MPVFGTKSKKQLETAHPDLQRLFNEVIKHWDCSVIEGKRSEARQARLFAAGASKTLQSKHVYPLGEPALALDVAPYPIKWDDTERFYAFGGFVVGVATMMGLKVRWGGDWDSDREFDDQRFFDLPHFELIL